jgi:hypothetical protein
MSSLALSVENVGGIDVLETTIQDGVTLVAGVNASNKTSFLHALLFGLGGPAPPIKTDADVARVELTIDGETYVREARRRGTGVQVDGEGPIADADDEELLERFAALTTENALRQAVERQGDVERLLKEPMDVEALREEQAALMERKRDLEAERGDLDGVADELAAARDDLAAKSAAVEDLEDRLADLRDRREDTGAADEEIAELRAERASLVGERDDLTDRVSELEAAADRLEERVADKRDELAAARETVAENDVEDLRAERECRREELETVEARLDVLQTVLTGNQEMLDSSFTGVFGYDAGLDEDRYTCWTCGDEAPASAFESTLEDLRDLVEADKRERAEVAPTIEDLDDRIREAERAERRVSELEADAKALAEKHENRLESLEQQRDRLEDVRAEIQALDEEIAGAEREQADEHSDLGATIEEVRVELATANREVDRLETRVKELEADLERRREVESELESVTADIQRLTKRIESQESRLRGQFNDAMADLIEVLAFDRIERVWLDGEFDLVVARDVGGAVREDSLEHLAESERAMIGLVLALAGFVTYDVGEVTPAVVLDSLGAFDAERTRRLVEYFSDHVDVLLAAVHPEVASDASEDAHQLRFRTVVEEVEGNH